MKQTVLVVASHPDDAELGIGGTILRHIDKGDNVHILCVTDGEHIAKGRINETRKSAEVMGCSVSFLHLPDTKVPFNIDTISKIEDIVNKIKPYRVYTHSISDMHQDHQNTCKSTLVACRRIPQILFFTSPERSVEMGTFKPNFFIDISKYIDRKIQVSKLHKSISSQKDYFKENVIRGESAYWGSKIRVSYAECFELFRFIELEDDKNGRKL